MPWRWMGRGISPQCTLKTAIASTNSNENTIDLRQCMVSNVNKTSIAGRVVTRREAHCAAYNDWRNIIKTY